MSQKKKRPSRARSERETAPPAAPQATADLGEARARTRSSKLDPFTVKSVQPAGVELTALKNTALRRDELWAHEPKSGDNRLVTCAPGANRYHVDLGGKRYTVITE